MFRCRCDRRLQLILVILVVLAGIQFAVSRDSRQSIFAQGRRALRISAAAAGEFGWLADYEQAKTIAKQTGKPLMVVIRCVP